MLNDEQKRQKAKLEAQVRRYEAKGYMDTVAHLLLARLQQAEKQTDEGVTPRNTKKVKQEAQDGE
jgi:hypothetical protein